MIHDMIHFIEKGTWNKPKTLVLDADALNIIAADIDQSTNESFKTKQQQINQTLVEQLVNIKEKKKANIIITPHVGEASRLLKTDILQVKKFPIKFANKLYTMLCDVCVLKDYATVTTGKNGTYINTSGNCGMATAGSGDVLTGIIAGTACLYKYEESVSPEWIAAMAVYIHGCAGDICKKEYGINGMVAWDIAEAAAKMFQ